MLSHHERKNMAISKSGLPQKVLELFDPREDLEFKPALDRKKPALPLLGIAGYVAHFPGPEDPSYQPERPELATAEERKFRSREYNLQVWIGEPSIVERREKKAVQRAAQQEQQLQAALDGYDPKSDPNIGDTDPMKTLFVSRLPYTVTEDELQREFGKHGSIKSLRLVRDTMGKSRGYAFIEYNHSGDMKIAYKAYPPDGFVRLGGSKMWSVVDVERGRTVPDWRPTRLGGGKGGEGRRPRPKQTKKAPAGMPPPPGIVAAPSVERRPMPEQDAGRRYGGEPRAAARPDRGRENGHGPPVPSRSGGDRYAGREDRERYSSRDSRHVGGRDERRSETYPDRRSYGHSERGVSGDRSGHFDRSRDRHGGKRDRVEGAFERERSERRVDTYDRDYKRGRVDSRERERYSGRDRHGYR